MTPIAAAATTTASTLARPMSPARSEGSPNTPLPMTQFTMSAAILQRLITRTNPSPESCAWVFSCTASFVSQVSCGLVRDAQVV